MKNNYTIICITPTYILLLDSGDGISITNSAEEVIKHLYSKGKLIEGIRCFYIDTDGRVDELLHDNGTFIDFKPGYEGVSSFYKAAEKFNLNFDYFVPLDENDF